MKLRWCGGEEKVWKLPDTGDGEQEVEVSEEDDMLDLAYELTDTSRLGCQITVREDFAGMKVTIPDDGF